MNWPVFAAAVGGPAVGIVGVVFPYLGGREQRRHDRDLARSQRLHDELRLAYQDLLELLYRAGLAIRRTHPEDGVGPTPPAAPSEEEMLRISACVSTICSEEVNAALEESLDSARAFWEAARQLTEVTNDHGDETELRTQLNAARKNFLELTDKLERLIRADIRA